MGSPIINANEQDVEFNDKWEDTAPDQAWVDSMAIDEVLVGSWGSFWRGFKKVFKQIFTGAAASPLVAKVIDKVAPGAGDAVKSGVKLIQSAAAGNGTALAQIKGIADAAKAGDTAKQGAHDLLTTINDARKEAQGTAKPGEPIYTMLLPDGSSKPVPASQAEVGAALVSVGKVKVLLANGKYKTFPSKEAAQAWMKANPSQRPGARSRQQRRPPTRRPGQAPVSAQQVQRAIQSVPPGQRQALVSRIQQTQQQNLARYPYGLPGQQGVPYGMAPGYPYGYGVPAGYQQPYGPAYADEGMVEQQDYYAPEGSDDEGDLAAAFAQDEQFPDEGGVND